MAEAVAIHSNPLLMAGEHWERLKVICQHAAKSGLLPSSVNTPEKALIIALKGIEVGFSPMQAFERINVINGKASIDGQGLLSLIYSRGQSQGIQVEWGESTNESATVTIRRKNQPEKKETFTIQDAEKAGLLDKKPWQQYPKAMLRWRVLSACARIACPDVIGSIAYTHEEMGYEVDAEGQISAVQIKGNVIAAAKEVKKIEVESPEYTIPLGTLKGKTFSEVHPADLAKSVESAQKWLSEGKVEESVLLVTEEFIRRAQIELKGESSELKGDNGSPDVVSPTTEQSGDGTSNVSGSGGTPEQGPRSGDSGASSSEGC